MTENGKKEEQATNRFIRSIRLRNLLSFGPDSEEIKLEPLNVLIGPNASGKSNFIEAISLLKAAPVDIIKPFLEGEGHVQEWVWNRTEEPANAEIEVTAHYPEGRTVLRHALGFRFAEKVGLEITSERIEPEHRGRGYFYKNDGGGPVHLKFRPEGKGRAGDGGGRELRTISRAEISTQQSILSQRRDPDQFPEITYLGEEFRRIQLFRKWQMGPDSPARKHQATDLPGDFLLEDASNLARIIDSLRFSRGLRDDIHKHLAKFADHMIEVTTKMDFGTASVYVEERGGHPISARRLSDGTLRYLCLLVILCHPEPPPLICIEEPELGLHPDMIGEIAELLVEASKRTQLIVTTHSEILVSALSETPEFILVCEQDAGGTKMRRLKKDRLKKWLERYSLGDLWRKGVVGGNRW